MKGNVMRNIDLTPSWLETAQMLAVLFQSRNFEAQQTAHAELIKMAKLADAYVQNEKVNP
jgi:hypothetical protein